ncbi:AsmA-like C-terminal region-containing protein [uncultured Hymenobacter sp.]|uniref:AsmA family protein n=1 Tax=uncultured Hymenobacter sp. TaxID=170016 RepID=UPI0035CAC047
MMRKILLGLLAVVVVLMAAAVAAPFLFKDKLRALADRQIAQRLRAQVQYDPNSIDVSLLRSFPELTVSLRELRIIGQDSFRRDTLAYLPAVRVGLDVMSVVRGGAVDVNSIALDRPDIQLKVLKSGRSNWDIVVSDSTAAAKGQDTSQVQLAIRGWNVTDGHLRYEDLGMPFLMRARGVQHSGRGDFARNVFDMTSQTTADSLSMTYGGVAYVSDKRLTADVTMAMDLNRNLYTFKNNQIRLNDFPFSFAGAIGLPNEKDITYDLTFKALETDFKNILSLVPGVFTERFKNIQTSGKVAFDGYYKGTQNALRMPGYGVNLMVNNGEFKYPDLPQAARNINVKMRVDNPSGFTNNVKVNVERFHLDLGPNPVDGSVTIDGLEPMKVNGQVKANVNLAEALKVYPVPDLAMRGQFFVDATANGTYSKTQMPVVNAAIRLTNGYVKSAKFPAPLENVNLSGTVVNRTGQVNDTRVDLPQFAMTLDGEPLQGRLTAQNLNAPVFDTDVRGTIDLTKITKIFPLEGMTVTGRVSGNVAAAGNMADVEAGRYQNVRASGTVTANNVTYKSKDLPQGVRISRGTATFNNNQIAVQSLQGTAGSSDFTANGTVSNYLGYLFTPGQPLRGNLNVNANRFNLNEWMVDEVSGQARPTPSKATGVLEVPKFFDLTLNSTVGQVIYDNLNLTNARGAVVVRDQTATLQNLAFNTLGGSFTTTGSYSSKDLAHPKFSLGLKIDDLNFQNAFQAFNTIKALVPLAGRVEGVFNTSFNVSGEMLPDMRPNLNSLTGRGVFDIVKAAVLKSEVLGKISALTTLPELKDLVVVNKAISTELVNGNFIVKPFDLTIGDVKMTIGGSNSVAGALAYVTALNVPTGRLGSALTGQLTRLTGVRDIQGAERVTLGLNIGGSVTSPSVKLTSGSVKDQAKTLVTNVVKTKLTNTLLDLATKNKARNDSTQQSAAATQQETEERLRLELERRRLEAEAKARQKVGQGINAGLDRLFGKPKPKAPTPPPAPEPAEAPAPADTAKAGG